MTLDKSLNLCFSAGLISKMGIIIPTSRGVMKVNITKAFGTATGTVNT